MLLQTYPCEIVIKQHHNHPVHAAEVLRRRRPTETVKKKFVEIFQKGHSPLSALECHKFHLKTEHGEDHYVAAADGSICPSNLWVYKLYKKLCIEKYGPQCGEDMINAMKSFCGEFNSQSNKDSILLLCIFHVLQAFLLFIWNRESAVPKKNRSELFFLFKDLVYARSEEEFQDRLKDAMENEHLNQAPKVKCHLEKLLPRINEWALFLRQDLLTRGTETNNYSEINMRILKEKCSIVSKHSTQCNY